MGEVLLARQTNLGRLVVIKRVPSDHPAKHVRALLAEARLAARLHHPCIVSVLDVSADDEEPFVAMEYVPGVTLREMLEKAPDGLPVAIALFVAIDVLRGLAYAHGVRSGSSTGVVHRDIKPRNVMVTFAGDVKLVDFGIARALEDTGAWEATSISGTRGYMAPEQQAGVRVDGRADQYAVGVTLREMLTGVSPADGEETSDLSAVPAPRRPTPLDDAALAAIVERASARAPDLRYADCAELAAALEAYAAAHALAATPSQVERWMRDHLASRIARFEREAKRASESEQGEREPERGLDPGATTEGVTVASRPPGREASAGTVSSGQQVPATRIGGRGGRGRLVAVLGAAAVLGGGAAYAVHVRGGGGAGDGGRVVGLVAVSTGSAGEAWLAPAVEHLGRRALRDAEARRFPLGAATVPGARRVELAYQLGGTGVHVEARLAGAPAPLASADGPSLVAAVDELAPALAEALSGDAGPLEPDAAEAIEMTQLAVRSFAEYRRFRRLYEDGRLAGWVDSSALAAQMEEVVHDDPTWARPYGELHWLYGTVTDRAAKALVDGAATADAGRDPEGAAITTALQALRTRAPEQAIAAVEPVFRRNNADMLAAETYQTALQHLGRDAEASAVFRRMMELYPSLYFAGDLITDLESEGRDDDAEALASASFTANPDNLTSGRELVRLAAQRGDLTGAREIAHRMLLVHGEAPGALAELFDAMLVSEDMAEAQRISDQMLLGSPLSRARGRYRGAVIAVAQGRFAAAYGPLQAALVELAPFGREAETPQVLQMLRMLAPLLGDAPGEASYTAQLAAWFDGSRPGTSAGGALVRFQGALAAHATGGACPVFDDRALDADERAPTRLEARRFAAMAGCAPCREVVAAGLLPSEGDPASLIAFGRCAQSERELPLARRAFEQATRLWSSWDNHQASPYHATLAQFYLGATAASAGDAAAARAHYTRFLHAWGRADRALPEVHDAERALAELPAP